MTFLHRLARSTALVGIALVAANAAVAQVSAINSVKVFPREFNDDPTSQLTIVNNYPTRISIDDQSVDNNGSGSGFANRHSWKFSTDNGATAYLFKNDDFFDVSMDLTLTGTVTPRKEAGFLLTTENGGEGQFIVNTDKHEVVAFGGPFPFFAFDSTFDSGETIHLGMTYFRDTDGKRKIIYHAGDQSSSALEFTNNEQGIEIGKTTLGGYLQVQIANDPNNFATANFDNIRISVPAPSALPVFALGSAWGLSLLLRRHKKEKTQKENGSA